MRNWPLKRLRNSSHKMLESFPLGPGSASSGTWQLRAISHEIARAIMNATAAASPPISTVWLALRSGGAPVK